MESLPCHKGGPLLPLPKLPPPPLTLCRKAELNTNDVLLSVAWTCFCSHSGWFARGAREGKMALWSAEQQAALSCTPTLTHPPNPPPQPCCTNSSVSKAAKSIRGDTSEQFGFSSHPLRAVVLSDPETTSGLCGSCRRFVSQSLQIFKSIIW